MNCGAPIQDERNRICVNCGQPLTDEKETTNTIIAETTYLSTEQPHVTTMGFCEQCGARITANTAFCEQCGAPLQNAPASKEDGTKDDEMKAAARPDQSVPQEQEHDSEKQDEPEMPAAQNGNRKKMIIGILAAIVVILAVVIIVLLVMPHSGSNNAAPTNVSQRAQSASTADEQSQRIYKTRFPEVRGTTSYPSFTFEYPGDWTVTYETVDSAAEHVTLSKIGTDISIDYSLAITPIDSLTQMSIKSVANVANSSFWPGFAEGSNQTYMGPFMVADITIEDRYSSAKNNTGQEFYAVLPVSVLQSNRDGFISADHQPAFLYPRSNVATCVSFACKVPSNGLTAEDKQEVISILSSFSNGTTKEQYETLSGDIANNAQQRNDADYLIPDSDSRLLSDQEMLSMDLHDLYLARNEIYARHGRLFKNDDLQSYFNSKAWYNGTIAPEDFDDSVLNDYERKNAARMLEIEQEQDSPYAKP